MLKRTLLIVESPGVDSGRFRRLARSAGFKLLTANNGAMTASFVRRAQPAVVLVAPLATSPGPAQIARSIKEDPQTSAIPVLLLVASERARKTAYPTEACLRLDSSDDELLSTIRLLARSNRPTLTERRASSPLEGHLGDDTFPDVLQFLFTMRKTGRVTVNNGAQRPGQIYIEAGSVIHAEYAKHAGREAFQKLCFATDGQFKFEPGLTTSQRSVDQGGIELLLASAEAEDDAKRPNRAARRTAQTRVAKLRRPTALPSPDRRRPTKISRWLMQISRALGQ